MKMKFMLKQETASLKSRLFLLCSLIEIIELRVLALDLNIALISKNEKKTIKILGIISLFKVSVMLTANSKSLLKHSKELLFVTFEAVFFIKIKPKEKGTRILYKELYQNIKLK